MLAGFAIGMLVWLGAAVAVLVGVVTGWFGGLLPDILAVRWASILCASSAVLGLGWWVLLLLGWRRTREGETRFRRGLAGGILMAVTGVMLLPGVVSIIGDVLRRRDHGREILAAQAE